jgi:hypothetical protein
MVGIGVGGGAAVVLAFSFYFFRTFQKHKRLQQESAGTAGELARDDDEHPTTPRPDRGEAGGREQSPDSPRGTVKSPRAKPSAADKAVSFTDPRLMKADGTVDRDADGNPIAPRSKSRRPSSGRRGSDGRHGSSGEGGSPPVDGGRGATPSQSPSRRANREEKPRPVERGNTEMSFAMRAQIDELKNAMCVEIEAESWGHAETIALV